MILEETLNRFKTGDTVEVRYTTDDYDKKSVRGEVVEITENGLKVGKYEVTEYSVRIPANARKYPTGITLGTVQDVEETEI